MNTEKTLKEPPLSLSEAWEKEAKRWATAARKPGHDSYWQFHRDQFFSLLPGPGMLTVDVGCGEGRVTRDLKRLGHKVIGIDVSATLIRLAREEDPKGKYFHAPASCMPLQDACADLAIAFMSLQDVDDLEAVRSYLGLSRIDLIGHSYAGIIPILYAMKYPDSVNRVVQISPMPPKRISKKPSK